MDSMREIRARLNAQQKIANAKSCFFKDENCTEIIKAHGISRGRILMKLAENGKVIGISPNGDEFPDNMIEEVGINATSTFSGMCKYHDQKLFSLLDNEDYVYRNAEMEKMFYLRTIASYNYFCAVQSKTSDNLIQWVKKKDMDSINKYAHIDKIWTSHIDSWVEKKRQADTAMAVYSRCRDLISNIDINELETKIATRVIELPKSYPVASSGLLTFPHEWLATDIELPPLIATYNIFPQNNKSIGIFTTLEPLGELLDLMFEHYDKTGYTNYGTVLTDIILRTYNEAFAVTPSYWNSLDSAFIIEFSRRWMVFSTNQSTRQIEKDFSLFI
jgi:hypothetical protein